MNWYLRVALYIVFTFGAYVCSLLWAFPREFHPLVPYRPDLYYPVGLLGKSVAEVSFYPRPVTYLFQQASGLLGIQGAIGATIVIVLATATLVALVVFRISDRLPSPLAFLAFLILLFTHPEFYFHHRFDVPSVVSGLFLLLAILCAYSWLREPRHWRLIWALFFVAAMALSKETYDLSAPLILAGLCCCYLRRCDWRRAVLLLGSVCAVIAVAEAFNIARFFHYAGKVSAASTYAPNLHAVSILTTLGRYLKDLLPATQFVIVVLALIFIGLGFRKRPRKLFVPAAFLLAGIAALIPNSVLPLHYESQYAWNAAPLLFAILLFVPASQRWGMMGQTAIVVSVLFSVHANASFYNSPPKQWLLNEEHANARISSALPTIRSAIYGTHRLIVTGLESSFHPWAYPDFIVQYFGSGVQWTFVVPRGGQESTAPGVLLVRARGIALENYDGAVQFHPNGSLQSVLVGAAYREAVARSPDAVLIPALAKQAEELALKPSDFMLLLGMGTQALSCGLPERALPYLRRAAELDPSNPYPWFFMGQALQDTNDLPASRGAFEKAVGIGGLNGNPVFRQALSALK